MRIEYQGITLNKLLTTMIFPEKGSFYVRSASRFMYQHALWKTHLPAIQPYYAVKCNPDPLLLQWVQFVRGSFDCASAKEMVLVHQAVGSKLQKEQILFANPCKTSNDIAYAKELEVPWVTADSMEELVKMNDAGYTPNLLLRINVDDTNSACPFGAKFGLELDEVKDVAAVANSLAMPIVGLSFHVGSGSSDPTAYQSAIHSSYTIWNSLQKLKFVDRWNVLDIGGGWSPTESTFLQQATSTKEALRTLLTKEVQPNRVIAEPGRFFAAPIQDLYVKVIGKKPRKGGGWRYTIDESIYGQFSCIPYDHATPRFARVCLNDQDAKPRRKSPATLFGRTCDSLDWIANSVYMEELEIDDWLYIPNMGAYTTATSTEFNGFPKPCTLDIHAQPPENTLRWLDTLHFPLASMLRVPDT